MNEDDGLLVIKVEGNVCDDSCVGEQYKVDVDCNA